MVEAAASSARRRWLGAAVKGVALVLGLGLLAYMVHRAGPAKLLGQLEAIGPWFLAVLGVSSTWFVLNTWGWRFTFEPPRKIPFLSLLQTHLVSEAVSNVTPSMALGGEPLKVVLLRHHVGASAVLAAVVNDNMVHVVSGVIFMMLGLAFGMLAFDIEARLLWMFAGAIVVFGLLTWALLARGRKGLVAPLARLGVRLRLPYLRARPELVERAATVDARVGQFLGERRPDFLGCLVGHLLGRLMGAVEAWVILWAVGTPVDLGTAIFIIAVIHVLVNMLFSIIPSQLGAQEAVAYGLFTAIGLDPSAAVALALVRRIRGFVWIGIGLLLLSVVRGKERRRQSDAEA